MTVKVRLLKWQGPVVPERTTEPPRLACLDVPAINMRMFFASGMADAIRPENRGRRYAGVIHENALPLVRTTGFMNELCAPYAEEGYVEVARFHDEIILEPIAEESDADRML